MDLEDFFIGFKKLKFCEIMMMVGDFFGMFSFRMMVVIGVDLKIVIEVLKFLFIIGDV